MPITRPSTQEDADNRLREAFIIQDFGALGGEVESYPLPDRNALLYSSATSAWAERILGVPANPYHPGWQGRKDGIVRSYFGEREAKDVSDEDLFGKIATDYRAQEKIANAARIAAARGESWLGKFREVETQEAGSIIPGRMTNYLGLARAAHDEMAAKVNPYRNTIKAVADMARNIDTSAEGMDWGAMASELVKIPKEDRPYVLEALSLQTPGESKAGDAERIKTAFVRGMERYLDTAVSSLETAGESTAGEFLRQSYGFDVEAQTPEQKAQRADFLDLRDDMRDIATGKLAPLKAVKIAGMNIAGAAEMLPMTLGSFVPYVGAAVTLGSFQRSTYNDIRRSNPEMSRDSANAIATVSAPFQAITEIASDRFLFGRLPNLKRAFTQPIFSATGALGMFATRAAIGTATEVGEEFIQGVTPLAIQDLSKALGQDLPGSDWNGFLGEFAQSLPELISTILPLAIVGAGTGQLSDFRAGRQLARSPDMLIAAQYSPESAAKISELANAGKWSEAEDAMRLDWAKINAKGADMAQVKATAEQRIQAAERLKSLQSEQANTAALIDTSSPEFVVNVTRSPAGWQVAVGDGTIIPVDSAEAARRIAVDLRQVGSQQEADALVSVIDGYYEKGRQAETVLTGEKVEASEEFGVVAIRRDAGGAIISQRQLGPQALETVRAEAEVAGIKTGTRGVFAHINGSNEVFPMRVADGAKEIVRRMNLYKSQAEGQPQVMTFLHENFESTWRLGIENGTFSDQETRTAMRALLPAFEGVTALNAEEAQFIDNLRTLANGQGNETMLRETVSEMVMRDVLGRDRQGLATGMKPGSISSAIEASVMGANTQEEVSALKSILAAIKAFTAYLKGVLGTVDAITKARDEGKLGEEYDTFINKVLGIDEVKQMKQAAVEEGKAILGIDEEAQAVIDAGNMAFSISPVTPEQDAAYLQAVKAGDSETAQRLVDEAAKIAGLEVSSDGYWRAGEDQTPNNSYLTDSPETAEQYATNRQTVRRIFYKKGKSLDLWSGGGKLLLEKVTGIKADSPYVFTELNNQSVRDAVWAKGYDSIEFEDMNNDGGEHWAVLVKNGNQIKSADPVTYDDAGNVIPLSQRFNPETPNINFSISPIRNLNELSDQVERNFAENPAGALEVKSKVIRQFAKLADKWSNERWTPQGNKIRPISEKRTVKSLDKEQAMRQATLEGEKIAANMEASQALKEAKAEAQSWRDEADAMQKEDWSPRESLVRDLITLEAIVAMFPQEIRGKIGGFVTLARKASEAARLKVLQRQLERGQELLEKHLKEQYGTAVDKLLERYQSKRDSSGRISGKILSTATEQVDYAAEFIDLDIASQAKEQAALERQVEESESAEEVQDALTKLGIARLFEVWSTKDSASRESAFLWLNETIEQGKQGKKLLDEERKAFLDDMRQSGKSSILQGDELNPAIADNLTNLNKGVMRRALLGMRGVLSESLWTTLQRLELIFGEDSKILDYFAGKIINAANLSTDIKRMVEAQKKEALFIIFNSDSKFAHARGIAELQKMKDSGVMISKVTKKEIKLDIDTLTKLADGTMDAKTAGLEQAEVDAALEEFAANARKRTVTIEKVTSRAAPTSRTMSETQGIQWWLWSMQDASRKQMELDGWDADSFAQLEKFLSPEAKALGRWISGSYQDAAGMIDPIYRKLFNAPLPRIKNYSPIHRRNMNAGGEVMDLDSSDMNSGLAAGFTKSRVNTTASLVESDALAVFLAHWENVSHWVAHAELMRDMKAILLDKDTAVAIRQKKSEGYLQRLKQDISTIESNGTSAARELVDISRMWRWFMQFRAYKGLAFRISPIIKQTPAMLNPLLADVPAHNYMMGLSRAFIEPQAFASEVSAMWKSDIIRRRIESGFSAESRVAMQGTSMTGSQAILAMQTGMMPMQMVDGGWTALGAAISFDYYRRGYMRDNPQMTPEIADSKAIARVEKMIATSAQPSDIYARSLRERSGNLFMRGLAMFVSETRKTLAIELMAIRKLATGKSKNKALDIQRFLVAHFVMAGVSQLSAMVIASLLGDDEDRDREWSVEQWTLALALGPVNGMFVFGKLIDRGGRFLINSDFYQERFGTGQKLSMFPDDNLSEKAFTDVYKAVVNVNDLFNPENPDDFMNEIDNVSSAVGAAASTFFGPAAGAVDVSANVLREARKIQDRLSE